MRRAAAIAKWTCTLATVLLVATWLASRWYWWSMTYQPAARYTVAIQAGRLWLYRATGMPQGPPGIHDRFFPVSDLDESPHWFWWFEYSITPRTPLARGTWWSLYIPLWSLILLTAVPAALLWWRSRKFGPGRCPTCAYDLRGLPPNSACPECGNPDSSRGSTQINH